MKLVSYETFAFDEDQYENLWAALQRAAEVAGKKNLPKSALLDMVLVDFLATNDFRKSSDPQVLSRYLSRLEGSLGVRLVALDPSSKRLVYGADTVAWAAGE